jgi:hypothetical protein
MHKRPSAPHHPAWRTRCVRLVVLALLWGWLAAPLVQALSPPGSGWVQVCTSLGTKFVQLDQDGSASAPQDSQPAPSASPSTDCPYCRAHANLALAPAGVRIPELPSPVHSPPLPPAPRATSPEAPWPPALPRAPPSTTSA